MKWGLLPVALHTGKIIKNSQESRWKVRKYAGEKATFQKGRGGFKVHRTPL